MNLLTVALSVNGMAGFSGGAFLLGMGQSTAGSALMGVGLILQIAALVRLRREMQRQQVRDDSHAG